MEEKRSYNLSRGDASTTLNQFAAASERPIIFMVAKVRGVQTNVIVGKYSPTDALEQMLLNTELRAITDPASGAFVVTRKEAGGEAHVAMASTPQTPEIADKKMKLPKALRRVAAAISLFIVQQANAQTAEPSAEATKKEEVIELSPFQVTSRDEMGYVATSSLVGSRVNTELKDIASQIDVMTPEFLQDIGATSIADAVLYSSNFGAPNEQNIGPNDGISSTSLEGRARGYSAATVSTDFYASNLPIDFYNIERLNLAYGAQSVLFGLGNAGGVLDSSTKRAEMRNKTKVELKADSWGTIRGMLDYNQVLIPKKLAIRLVGLDSDYRQYTEGGKDKLLRGFGTITFQPFTNTKVRASFEQIDVTSQRATNYLSYDFVTPWVTAGRPLYDNSKGNATIATSDPLFSKNTNTLRVYSYGGASDSYAVWNGTSLTKGPNQVPGAVNLNLTSIIDSNIYPTDLDPRVLGRENQITGSQFRASIEQRINKDLYLELGFSREVRDELSGGPFDNNESVQIRADSNAYVPGGTTAAPKTTLNPNAGKLYVETFPHGNVRYNLTQELRLTSFYEFKSSEHFGGKLGWLGRHRLAMLLSTREDRNESQEERAVALGTPSFATGSKLDNSRLLRTRYYLDSPSDPASKGNYIAKPNSNGGMFGPYVLNDPTTNESVSYALFNNPEGSFFVPIGSKIQVKTAMAALQSFFLKDKLNLFAGLRQDQVKTFSLDPATTKRHGLVTPTDQLGLFPHLNEASYSSTPDAVKTSIMRTYGVVAHPMSWISFFYNTSANTSLPPGRFGPYGNPLTGVSSEGFDYGVRFDVMHDRLSIRMNFFDDKQTDHWDNPFTQLRDFSANIEQRLRGPNAAPGVGAVAASTFDPVGNPVALYRSVTDRASKGFDLVVVANLTSNWSLRATVGRQYNTVVSRGREWIQWINERLPVWQGAGGLGWDNVAISTSDSRSIHQYYLDTIVPQAAAQELAKGILSGREREWRANLFTNYRFTEGKFKGFNVGGGVRWWSEGITGNGGIIVPGIAAAVEDPNIIFRDAKPQTFCDLVIGYKRRIRLAGHGYQTNFQLNVRNIFDKDELEVSRTDKSGAIYEYVRPAPRQIVFSTAIEF